MSPIRSAILVPLAAMLLLSACGNKEEAPPTANVQFDCSIAPSQSKVFSALSSSAGGASAATMAIAQALGLAAVPHSSGALILTGGSGYIAGTLGTAFILPAVIYGGAGAAAAGVAIELICFPRNHPDSASRLEASIKEFMSRTAAASEVTYKLAAPVGGKLLQAATQTGEAAIEYARRKSVEVEEAIRSATR